MATDCAEAATAVLFLVGCRVFETVLDDVMQQCRLPKHEQ